MFFFFFFKLAVGKRRNVENVFIVMNGCLGVVLVDILLEQAARII